MKHTILILLAGICSTISCTNKQKKMQLKNSNYLRQVDSLTITMDSLSYPYSSNIYFRDSVLYFLNEGTNTVSLYRLTGEKIGLRDFNDVKRKNKNFSADAAWSISEDSLFVNSKFNNKVYLFSKSTILVDSFQLPVEKDYTLNTQYPESEISSCQQPVYYCGSLFTTGFRVGENLKKDDLNKFVVCESNKNGRFFYVNYPEDYIKIDWGGIYYKMVYHCQLNDDTICISFPASSRVAIFNMKTKTVTYQTMFPNMKEYIEPYNKKKQLKFNKDKIADHFYSQYSFRGIIYDKYRKLFYRFLLKPTTKDYLKKQHMGPQEKFLLVYDEKFNYLGYNELDATYSHFTFFVAEKGLYIQHIKNNKDENHICFDIFTIRRDGNKQL
jgi:Domain of unknown function (DUF4221)